jgi:hypothetical protein
MKNRSGKATEESVWGGSSLTFFTGAPSAQREFMAEKNLPIEER